MTKREWLLLGVILVLGIVIAGCSAPVKAEDSQAHTNMKWSDDVSDGHTLAYQSFSEIQVPEHNMTCFVFRSSQGVAMQCFNNNDIYNGGQ